MHLRSCRWVLDAMARMTSAGFPLRSRRRHAVRGAVWSGKARYLPRREIPASDPAPDDLCYSFLAGRACNVAWLLRGGALSGTTPPSASAVSIRTPTAIRYSTENRVSFGEIPRRGLHSSTESTTPNHAPVLSGNPVPPLHPPLLVSPPGVDSPPTPCCASTRGTRRDARPTAPNAPGLTNPCRCRRLPELTSCRTSSTDVLSRFSSSVRCWSSAA